MNEWAVNDLTVGTLANLRLTRPAFRLTIRAKSGLPTPRVQGCFMLQPKSTLSTIWLAVSRLFELHGLDAERLMADLGVAPATLRDVGARIPANLADLAFGEAMCRIADPAFALRAAECWHPSNLGTLGYAWFSSRTLHTGLKRMQRFSRIIGDDFSYDVRETARELQFVHHHGRGDDAVGHAMTDFTLSIIVDMCRRNTANQLKIQRVSLRRPVPANPAPWQAFYDTTVEFGAQVDAFYLDLVTANAALPTANIPMANTFDEILTQQLDQFFHDDLVSRTKTAVLRHLTSGPPTAAQVAADLAMSQRSFQRKLGELGLTYQGVLDQTRLELARRYLDNSGRSLTEITFMLGFSEQSAFTRAFRRWSGMSPSGYRGVREEADS